MDQLAQPRQKTWTWWSKKRLRYNIGLVIAGITAFILYVILASVIIVPHDNEFEISLFATFVQGFGYLIMIGIANLLYFLGPVFDNAFNKNGSERFRLRLFNLGFWFSISLPFLIPIIIVIEYFTIYSG